MTGSQGGGGGEARPMTSVSGKIIMKASQSSLHSNSIHFPTYQTFLALIITILTCKSDFIGAGYHGSSKDTGSRAFDPLNIGKGPAPPLAEKSENSHEDKAKEMEKVCIVIVSRTGYVIIGLPISI